MNSGANEDLPREKLPRLKGLRLGPFVDLLIPASDDVETQALELVEPENRPPEDESKVEEFLSRLTPRQREILGMDMAEVPTSTIASLLSISTAGVRMGRQRYRREAKEHLPADLLARFQESE